MSALKEVIKLKNPENLVAAAVVNPDVMGPAILYQLILDHVSFPRARFLYDLIILYWHLKSTLKFSYSQSNFKSSGYFVK